LCLAKDPAERFQTVAELARALAPLAPPRSLLSVERAESIVGSRPRARLLEHTLRSAPASPRPLSVGPSSVTTRRAPTDRTRLRRVAGWCLVAGAVGGVTAATWIALGLAVHDDRVERPASAPLPSVESSPIQAFAIAPAPVERAIASVAADPPSPPREQPSATPLPTATVLSPPKPAAPASASSRTAGFGGLL
ncbi:MAG TPA: hypothetical protein VIF09_04250, partial [Polyangiaceae bacterium]